MSITKEKKKEIIEEVAGIVKDTTSVIFVNFHGLGVQDTNDMRSSFRKGGISYTVVKKTLVKRALSNINMKGSMPSLDGELALAYLSLPRSISGEAGRDTNADEDDLLAPAREVHSFAKRFKDNISIIGGIFEGRYMSREEMVEVAEIPPLPTLYGQFANIINSPIQGLVVALSRIAEEKGA